MAPVIACCCLTDLHGQRVNLSGGGMGVGGEGVLVQIRQLPLGGALTLPNAAGPSLQSLADLCELYSCLEILKAIL